MRSLLRMKLLIAVCVLGSLGCQLAKGSETCTRGFPNLTVTSTFLSSINMTRIIPNMIISCDGSLTALTVAGEIDANPTNKPFPAVKVFREITTNSSNYMFIGQVELDQCSNGLVETSSLNGVYSCTVEGQNTVSVKENDVIGLFLPHDSESVFKIYSTLSTESPVNYIYPMVDITSDVSIQQDTIQTRDTPQINLEITTEQLLSTTETTPTTDSATPTTVSARDTIQATTEVQAGTTEAKTELMTTTDASQMTTADASVNILNYDRSLTDSTFTTEGTTTMDQIDMTKNDETELPTPLFVTIIVIVLVLVAMVIALSIIIVVIVFLAKRYSNKKNKKNEVADCHGGRVDYSIIDSQEMIQTSIDNDVLGGKEASVLYKSLSTSGKVHHSGSVDSAGYTVVNREDTQQVRTLPSTVREQEEDWLRSEVRYESIPERNELNLPLRHKEEGKEKKVSYYEQRESREIQHNDLNHSPCTPVYASPSASVGIGIRQAQGMGYEQVSRYEQIARYETPATYETASNYQSAATYEMVARYETAVMYEKVTSSFISGSSTPQGV